MALETTVASGSHEGSRGLCLCRLCRLSFRHRLSLFYFVQHWRHVSPRFSGSTSCAQRTPPRGCVGSRAAASAPLIHCEDHKHPDTLTQRKTSVGAWPAPDFVSRYLHLPDGSSFCSSKHGVSSRPGRRQDSRPPRMPLLAWCARITSHPDHTSKESLSACTQALRLSYLLTPRKRTWCAGLVLHWSIIVTGCGLHAPTHDT